MPLSLVRSSTRVSIVTLLLASAIISIVCLFRDPVTALSSMRLLPFDVGQASTSSNAKSDYASVIESPPSEPPYGAVVIAAKADEDLSWTMFPKVDWEVYEYNVSQPNNSDPRLRFPQTKGREAMVYLSYIIDNYDSLPWCALFIHGHRDYAWHQEDSMARIIRNLNREALAKEGYMSLRCDWWPSCPLEIRPNHREAIIWGPEALAQNTEAALNGNWFQIFPDDPLPEALASQCCAQFAVTRQTIRNRPKSDYLRMRNWLEGSLLNDDISGRVFEKLWAYIFLGETIHCPDVRTCHCEWFERCGERNWTKAYNGKDPYEAV